MDRLDQVCAPSWICLHLPACVVTLGVDFIGWIESSDHLHRFQSHKATTAATTVLGDPVCGANWEAETPVCSRMQVWLPVTTKAGT